MTKVQTSIRDERDGQRGGKGSSEINWGDSWWRKGRAQELERERGWQGKRRKERKEKGIGGEDEERF